LDLSNLRLPSNAHIYVEAYHRTGYQRYDFGSLSNPKSPEDRRLTRNLYLALSLVNIRLLDHLLVAGSEPPFSFADQGLMKEIAAECAGLLR
jgi:hypothetical protein